MENNMDSYMIQKKGGGWYTVCVPGTDVCPHPSVRMSYVKEFVTDMDWFGEFKGYNKVFLDKRQIRAPRDDFK